MTWIIGSLNRVLVRHTGEDPAVQIMISLLMPFTAYMAAEHFHVSGILAAVVAGMAMHYVAIPNTNPESSPDMTWDWHKTKKGGQICHAPFNIRKSSMAYCHRLNSATYPLRLN
ncbi:cation:proton antiporter domain-containing protein [Noviherbaspirillum sp. Root189]|uniref:cation:proton antiporter domain-containing protein n=1 Tax=Noviherbaspirillum sp. Root189 TaxID=1736487 RepID=UPI00070C057E|nr:cation:proton antiporter [Noviherbaspirillum sp. Root189]KRB67798.1 hypothetical protein ASE07_08995 [Noviherbaspirillum sp. Root189]